MGFNYQLLGQVRFGSEVNDVLAMKGIKDIQSFLNPTKQSMESELLFDNIEEARDILVKHIENNSIIDLVVDCDVDGYTSAALIYQYIKQIKPSINIWYFIHQGKSHLLNEFVDRLCSDNSKLVIVPDAGTGCIEECKKITSCGKDVIILDHHKISSKGNPAVVVNNQLSEQITNKAMTGVGITYKFVKMLDKYYGVNYADDYLDLVAIGMIGDRADTMNLETRYLILEGLNQIKNKTNHNKLITTLIEAQMYSMDNKITISSVGFYICPLINSLIRLGEFKDKQYLFEAFVNLNTILERKVRGKGMIQMPIQEYVLKECESTNRKQKKLVEEFSDVLSDEIKHFGLDNLPILVCNAKDNMCNSEYEVDDNLIGLIANRLADQYQRPCLLMKRINDTCKGSGRGCEKCEIRDFNQWCKDTGLFTKVDGHPNAFGCEISFKNTDVLFRILSSMEKIDEPTYYIYGIYDANNFHDQIIKNIVKYDYIWGNTVDPPLFLIKNVICNKYNVNLSGARQNRIDFLYHNIEFVQRTKGNSLGDLYKKIISTGDMIEFDIIGKFAIDTKNGKRPQVIIEDMMFRKSDVQLGFGI